MKLSMVMIFRAFLMVLLSLLFSVVLSLLREILILAFMKLHGKLTGHSLHVVPHTPTLKICRQLWYIGANTLRKVRASATRKRGSNSVSLPTQHTVLQDGTGE